MPTDMRHLTEEQLALIFREIELPNMEKIVLIDVGGRKDIPPMEHNQNIYRIGPKNDILWQIRAGGELQERDSFVFLSREESGVVRASRFFGNEFVIDQDTGVAKIVGWGK